MPGASARPSSLEKRFRRPSASVPPRRFRDAAEWWQNLGQVPLERIVMDPLPGTATEKDLVVFAERYRRLCELVDGTLVAKPVGNYESHVAAQLIAALVGCVRPRKLGFVLGADAMIRMVSKHVRMPDVTFISVKDLPGGKLPINKPIATMPATIAAEILSKSNTRREISNKLKDHFESGTRLSWVLDPKYRTVGVYTAYTAAPDHVLTLADTLDGGDVLPGFKVKVAELFETSFK